MPRYITIIIIIITILCDTWCVLQGINTSEFFKYEIPTLANVHFLKHLPLLEEKLCNLQLHYKILT